MEDFAVVAFVGQYANYPSELYSWNNVSLMRYGDMDMLSPSCSDWLIPGTFSLED